MPREYQFNPQPLPDPQQILQQMESLEAQRRNPIFYDIPPKQPLLELREPFTEEQAEAIKAKITSLDDPQQAGLWMKDWGANFDSYNDMLNATVQEFSGVFDFQETDRIIDAAGEHAKLEREEGVNASFSGDLWSLARVIPIVANTANEFEFPLSDLAECIEIIARTQSVEIPIDSHFRNLQWTIRSAKKEGYSSQDIPDILSQSASMAQRYGLMNDMLYVLPATFEAKLSPKQIVQLFDKLAGENGPVRAYYTFIDFYNAVLTLSNRDVPSEIIYGILDKQLNNTGYGFGGFNKIPRIIEQSEALGLSVVDIVRFWSTALDTKGSNAELTIRALAKKVERLYELGEGLPDLKEQLRTQIANLDLPSILSEQLALPEPKDFAPVDTQLQSSFEAYRTQRSREQGEKELETLAKKDPNEGVWIYSPSQNMWYSLGGQTREIDEKVRFTFLPYELREFGADAEFYHTHPAQRASVLEQTYSHISDEQTRRQLLNFAMSVPSEKDVISFSIMSQNQEGNPQYTLHIMHGQGKTTFTVNMDLEKLAEVIPNFRVLKGQVEQLLITQLLNSSTPMNEKKFVSLGVTELQKVLSEGIKIQFEPYKEEPHE